MRVGGRFRFGHMRRERRSPWCDQSATHPSQKAAKDGAPTVWLCHRKAHPRPAEDIPQGCPAPCVFCKGRVLTGLTLPVFLTASSCPRCHSLGLSLSDRTDNPENCSTAIASVPSGKSKTPVARERCDGAHTRPLQKNARSGAPLLRGDKSSRIFSP